MKSVGLAWMKRCERYSTCGGSQPQGLVHVEQPQWTCGRRLTRVAGPGAERWSAAARVTTNASQGGGGSRRNIIEGRAVGVVHVLVFRPSIHLLSNRYGVILQCVIDKFKTICAPATTTSSAASHEGAAPWPPSPSSLCPRPRGKQTHLTATCARAVAVLTVPL